MNKDIKLIFPEWMSKCFGREIEYRPKMVTKIACNKNRSKKINEGKQMHSNYECDLIWLCREKKNASHITIHDKRNEINVCWKDGIFDEYVNFFIRVMDSHNNRSFVLSKLVKVYIKVRHSEYIKLSAKH